MNYNDKNMLTKTYIIQLCFLAICLGANAQLEFRRVGGTAPDIGNTHDFEGVSRGMCIAADFNGDGAKDVVLGGETNLFFPEESNLCLNDGFGNFSNIQSIFPALTRMHMTDGDVDGDGDIDLYMSGWYSGNWIHGLYLNDGAANFTSVAIPNVIATDFGFSKLIDLDGDGDLDLFVTGRDNAAVAVTAIYLNDGFGSFSPMIDSIEDMQQSCAAFGDLDNDGDIDIVIAGYNAALVRVCETYLNTPGGYTLLTNAALPGFSGGTLDLGDFDQDGDLDLLYTGQRTGNNYSSGLFSNNGSGAFTLVSTNIIGAYNGSGCFADIDNDTDLDIIINGNSGVGTFETEVYLNTNGVYTNSGNAIIGSDFSKLLIADLNNDNFVDLVVSGEREGSGSDRIADLYLNNGNGVFGYVKNSPFDDFGEYSAHGDLDGDGDLDVVICGLELYNSANQTRIYWNDGEGNFTGDNDNDLLGMRGEIDLVDFDGDGDLDIAICGNTVTSYASPVFNMVIYRNDGTGNFVLWNTLPGVVRGASWADVDGDNDLDYIITGGNNFGQGVTNLFLQDASNNFTQSSQVFDQLNYSDAHFFDCDNDGDKDVIISGSTNVCITKLYKNNGLGNFTLAPESVFEPIGSNPKIESTDMNGDGFLDLVISGELCGVSFVCNTYYNNGTGQFTVNQSFTVEGGETLRLVDMNNDGLADIIFDIYNSSTQTVELAYYFNEGSGNFAQSTTNLTRSVFGFFTLFDADGDNDNDIVLPGANFTASAQFFENVTGEITCTTASTDIISACESYTWIDGNTYFSSNSTATFTIAGGGENGCDAVVTLNLTIEDVLAPSADIASLPSITSECAVTSLIAPTATDNCQGTVTGSHNATLPITLQGTTTVMWTYDDGNGNISTQMQDVVIEDVTSPIPNVNSLNDLLSECEVSPTAPTGTDNCTGEITATPDLSFPITASGTTIITWTYEDGNGNSSTQLQNVIITPIDVNTTTTENAIDFTISADASGYNYQWIENCGLTNDVILGANSQSFTPQVDGTYAVILDNGTCSYTSDCVVIDGLGVDEGTPSFAKVYPNPTSGLLHIESALPIESIELFDALGKSVAIYSTIQENLEINCPAGVYFLRVRTEGEVSVVRLVKK